MSALRDYDARQTPQSEQARNDEVLNSAGGFVFSVSDTQRLERFLILGTDKGTYYASEQELTKQNISFVRELIERDEELVADVTMNVSTLGRAYRNTPAIFVAAALLTWGENKELARKVRSVVVRTGAHILEYTKFIENLRGWGSSAKKSVAEWYTEKDSRDLAYQVVKYRNRYGFTHRDVLRLSHPIGLDSGVVNFILGKYEGDGPAVIEGFIEAQDATSWEQIERIMDNYGMLPWEAYPTYIHKDPRFWKNLFYHQQLRGQALVRNITRLARIDAFKDLQFRADYAKELADPVMIGLTRLHPMQYLNALVVHQDGQIDRAGRWNAYRRKDWQTVPQILDALNAGFHASFKNVVPTNQRTLLALDVSPSMQGSPAVGSDLNAIHAASAMAMQIARNNAAYEIVGFTHRLEDLGISAQMDLNTVMKRANDRSWGATNIAQPLIWALNTKREFDTFAVLTDNETWVGHTHPWEALRAYRNRMGIPAKLAVFGTSVTEFTVADPKDSGQMDFVGFDSNAPKAFNEFSAGRL